MQVNAQSRGAKRRGGAGRGRGSGESTKVEAANAPKGFGRGAAASEKRDHVGAAAEKNEGKVNAQKKSQSNGNGKNAMREAQKQARQRRRESAGNSKEALGKGPQEDEEDEEELCLVCCEKLEFASLGSCNHPVCCPLCTARLRGLMNDNRCVLCKTELEKVFVTADRSKQFDSFQTWGDLAGPGIIVDDSTNMLFDESFGGRQVKEDISGLKSLCCGYKGCPDEHKDFLSFESLNAHLQEKHGLRLCEYCWESRGVFPMEQSRYTKAAYERHCTKGEKDTAFRGHPMCRFCSIRFYNNDMLYDHLKAKHENCFICQKEGRMYEYYRDYDNLYRHFQDAHFVCSEPNCLEAKFVAFGTEVELRGHIVSNHPDIKVDRTVPVNFTVRRSGFDGSGVDHRHHGDAAGQRQGGRPSSGGNRIDRMDFHYLPGQDANARAPAVSMISPAESEFLAQTAHQQVLNPSDLQSDEAFPELGTGQSMASVVASSSQYMAALGRGGGRGSALNDPEAFPALTPSARSAGIDLSSVRQGHSFSSAVDNPYNNLRQYQVQNYKNLQSKGKKGKKGMISGLPAQQPAWASREQLERDAILSNTIQSRAPVPSPAPAPSPAPLRSVPRGPTPVDPRPAGFLNPAQALERSAQMARSILDDGNFTEFQSLCTLFTCKHISAQAYYRQLVSIFPVGRFDEIVPLLVQSVPDIRLGKELQEIHNARQPASKPQSFNGDGAGWAKPRGANPNAANKGKEDFPSLQSSAPAGTSRPTVPVAASTLSQWDAFQASKKFSSGVTIGAKKKGGGKKKKDDLFTFY